MEAGEGRWALFKGREEGEDGGETRVTTWAGTPRTSATILLIPKLVCFDSQEHDHFCLGESPVPRVCPKSAVAPILLVAHSQLESGVSSLAQSSSCCSFLLLPLAPPSTPRM